MKILSEKLNFGHTNIVESFYLNMKQPLLHGFAIAKGMIIESFIAKKENTKYDDYGNKKNPIKYFSFHRL